MSAIAAALPAPFDYKDDTNLLMLAREVAINHYPLTEVLSTRNISGQAWVAIAGMPRFQELLATEKAAWESAKNTPSRVKLKSAAVVELYLREAHNSLHNPKEGLNHKVSLLKLVMELAGMGGDTTKREAGEGTNIAVGDQINISINIGQGAPPLAINATSEVTIEGKVAPAPVDFDWEEDFPIDPAAMERAAALFEDEVV